MEDVGIFFQHSDNFPALWYMVCPFGILYSLLEYFKVIWYILWPFVLFYGHLVNCPRFGMLYQEKTGNPALMDCVVSNNLIDAFSFTFKKKGDSSFANQARQPSIRYWLILVDQRSQSHRPHFFLK
jgi:hypothetical protein